MVIVNDTDLADQADGIVSRITYAGDRSHVYTLALSNIVENPMLGAGSKNLEYFVHAHNSYLQIAYKYGFFALVSWFLLVYLAFFRNLILFKHIDFILIFGLVSFFQIGLLNSNLVMLLILYCRFFSDKKLEHEIDVRNVR
jgi:O-antigen ligase